MDNRELEPHFHLCPFCEIRSEDSDEHCKYCGGSDSSPFERYIMQIWSS